ncbi:hypothetical protein HRbin30_02193 [bacterium HR30]|nr:hypothetical protein HRbin30_02193 [bacterium HR30]
MILCLCTGLTDRCVARRVALGLTDPAALMRETHAGRCSPACRTELIRVIREYAALPGRKTTLASGTEIKHLLDRRTAEP